MDDEQIAAVKMILNEIEANKMNGEQVIAKLEELITATYKHTHAVEQMRWDMVKVTGGLIVFALVLAWVVR